MERVLASVAAQRGVAGRFEVVVSDDGSGDDTFNVVRRFADQVEFRVRFTTHPHRGFQLARCRNEGVRASAAPYLLFLDGDCIIPEDHIHRHLDARQRRVVWAGYCCRLNRRTSEQIDVAAVRSGDFLKLIPDHELRKLARLHRKSLWYNLIRHPTKPKLFGGNIGIWRSDYESINGYDERFVGWGGEDDDLRLRLRRVGVRVKSILKWTRTYHLWHPPAPSAPGKCSEGVNIPYLTKAGRPAICERGLWLRASDGEIIDFGRRSIAETHETQDLSERNVVRLNDAPDATQQVGSCVAPTEVFSQRRRA